MMNGFLLVDKPAGWTSFDVVAKVRGIVKLGSRKTSSSPGLSSRDEQALFSDGRVAIATPKEETGVGRSVGKSGETGILREPSKQATGLKKPKVGHTGTLDPLATGLLIIVVGDYCKRAEEFSKLDKAYAVTMKLGQTSTTGDDEGEKVSVSDIKPSSEDVKGVLEQFVGNIKQVPPAFSAIKINGQRAYKMARAGQDVKLEARPVQIESIRLETYDYPTVCFTAHVGSGTYIRSLVSDIGNKLQTGAYMSALQRTSVGRWNLTEAVQVDSLTPETIEAKLKEAAK